MVHMAFPSTSSPSLPFKPWARIFWQDPDFQDGSSVLVIRSDSCLSSCVFMVDLVEVEIGIYKEGDNSFLNTDSRPSSSRYNTNHAHEQ